MKAPTEIEHERFNWEPFQDSTGSSVPLPQTPDPGKLLFSPSVDLSVFLGSAVAALLLLWIGARAGVLYGSSPEWTWVPAVLLIDVAHVYATAFRVYFDKEELKRKPWLYALVPVIGYLVGVALYSESDMLFWRVLAYLAVFHFVRQQYGWVALYRARLREADKLGKWIDTCTIYIATVYPLVYWHSNLPRAFWWFLPNDFAALPGIAAQILEPVYWFTLAIYAARSLFRWIVKGQVNPGKDIVVATTAICWYVGIVAINSDYAFTVTNVIIHGVPYFALVYWYARTRRTETTSKSYRFLSSNLVFFLLTLWLLAYVEELFWHRSIWHDRGWLFGGPWELNQLKMFVVPLLALPQLTHYFLDGFIWRRKSNPSFNLIR